MSNVYRRGSKGLERLADKRPNRRYSASKHPETGEDCLIEWTDAQEAKRDAEEAAYAAKKAADAAAPPQVTLEQRVEALEALVTALSTTKKTTAKK